MGWVGPGVVLVLRFESPAPLFLRGTPIFHFVGFDLFGNGGEGVHQPMGPFFELRLECPLPPLEPTEGDDRSWTGFHRGSHSLFGRGRGTTTEPGPSN